MPGMTLFDLYDLSGPSMRPASRPRPRFLRYPRPRFLPSRRRPPGGGSTTCAPWTHGPRSRSGSARAANRSEAKWVGGRIVVSVPAHLSLESRQKTVDWLVERLLNRHDHHARLGDDELLARTIALSDHYLVGARPASVRWVTNQTARWGSCSYYSGDIRVSHRLRVVPGWYWTRCWCTRWPT